MAEFEPAQLIGVGGGSLGLVEAVGEAEVACRNPPGAMVANAIGAALADTLSTGLHSDTTDGTTSFPKVVDVKNCQVVLASKLQKNFWQIGFVNRRKIGNCQVKK